MAARIFFISRQNETPVVMDCSDLKSGMRMKKVIFIMMIFLFSGVTSAALASEQLDMNAKPLDKSEELVIRSENKGVSSEISTKNVVEVPAGTQNRIKTIKIVIFASAFIACGIVWRRLSKHFERRVVRKHQNMYRG